MDLEYNLLVIVGPTASGKTDLAIRIAKRFNGEIVCADSRTVYRYLDIGTAKPSFEEQLEIKHWCIDLINPDEHFSAANFKNVASLAIDNIRARGKLPIVVGGSGLYIDGLLYDFEFGKKANQEMRQMLEAKTLPELQQIVRKKGLAMPYNDKNKRHLIRAIELGGREKNRHDLRPDTLIIGLDVENTTLKDRIHRRILNMLEGGLLDEVKLINSKYSIGAPGFSSNIYILARELLAGNISKETFLQQSVRKDYHLAKRQKTWFRRNNDIKWISPSKAEEFVAQKMLSVLK